jgi:hypothetical protein
VSPSSSYSLYLLSRIPADLQDRGLAGFFSGSSLRISRKAASSAIGWTVYEAMLVFIRDQQRDSTGTSTNTAVPR